MIDCSISSNYLKEKDRMCSDFSDCYGCPFYRVDANKDDCTISTMEKSEPLKVIETVQEWSNAHLPRTVLAEFLEHYPDVDTEHYSNSLMENYPSKVSPCSLGLVSSCCDHSYSPYCTDCRNCWNTLIDPSFKEGYEW